jgi:hypothetical protein
VSPVVSLLTALLCRHPFRSNPASQRLVEFEVAQNPTFKDSAGKLHWLEDGAVRAMSKNARIQQARLDAMELEFAELLPVCLTDVLEGGGDYLDRTPSLIPRIDIGHGQRQNSSESSPLTSEQHDPRLGKSIR